MAACRQSLVEPHRDLEPILDQRDAGCRTGGNDILDATPVFDPLHQRRVEHELNDGLSWPLVHI